MKKRDWTGIPGSQYPIFKGMTRTGRRWQKQAIYQDEKGYYFHKDPLHSEVEVYNHRGDHSGVLTPEGALHPTKGRDKRKNIRDLI